MARSLQPEFKCTICNKPIALETAKTDDDGRIVHGACYALRLAGLKPTDNPLASSMVEKPHRT